MAQAVFRIGLQWYTTHRFYKGDESLGRQAQAAGERAREIAKKDGGGGGIFAQAKRDLSAAKEPQSKGPSGRSAGTTTSKRVTPPKNKPTPTGRTGRPAPSGRPARSTPPAPRHPRKK